MKKIFFVLAIAIIFISCERNNNPKQPSAPKTTKKTVVVPAFNGDSAYYFVKAQCDFGPRVPGTMPHQQCAEWLVNTLNGYADTVFVQEFKSRIYDGKVMNGKNIIAAFNPDAKKRIIVAAHWDSRPYADNDPDEANWRKPIDGANDGASGCGIMMEMARVMKNHRMDVSEREDLSWGLGSQYWSKKPHVSNYSAYYGILLDMVGASNPRFPKEYYSQNNSAWVLNKVWRTAREMGYDEHFVNELGDPINDDHIYMIHYAGIPSIDIIDLVGDPDRTSCFFPYWHTLKDNIDCIDVKTLQMVGNVMLEVVYNE